MSKDLSDFEQIVALLQRHGVDFVVIGGQAEFVMGSPRVTLDTDITYRKTSENFERLARALTELRATLRGAPSDLPFRIDAKTLAMGDNFTFDTELGPFDLLGHVAPLGDFDAIKANVEIHRVGTLEIPTIGLEDLIRVKKHIRRQKDAESLRQLLSIRERRNPST